MTACLRHDKPNTLEIRFKNRMGEEHLSVIHDWMEVATDASPANSPRVVSTRSEDRGILRKRRNRYLAGYIKAFNEMGPSLREKLPREMLDILGDHWLRG